MTRPDTNIVGEPPVDNCRIAFERAWPQYAKDDKAWFCFSSGWSHCLIFLMDAKDARK